MTHIFRTGTPTRRTRIAALLATTIAIFAVACSDPLSFPANQTNSSQPFTVWALSGSPLEAPNGMSLGTRTIVRIDGGFAFDLAFDINAAGQAVILPASKVGTPIGGAALTGLQRVSSTYDATTEAPLGGYFFDSTMTVKDGATIVIQSQQRNCTTSLTPYIFAKIVFDSVNVTTRMMHGHTMIDLNCGYRQLVDGLPKF